MPLPATWTPLHHVGAARRKGSRTTPRSNAKIYCPIRSRQFARRTTCDAILFQVRCNHVRRFPEKTDPTPARKRRLVLILDNARYHHARILQPFLAERRHILSLSVLPPYSPELNPVERVWKLARRLCTHNQYFPQLSDLIAAVTYQLEFWKKPNIFLRSLCGII
jgi:hypothetical protein